MSINQADGYFRHHIFFCLNEREANDARGDCARLGSKKAFEYTKKKVKELGIAGEGQVRVNQAGCLDRCADGPVCVVYPDNVWYQYVDESDLDDIVHEHLHGGQVVERLLVKNDKK